MPLVQLDFPNPLNTSVQIGDTAYFSNPIDYGTTGNPLSGNQWASTTTPHLTSDQSDIIKIGVITAITPWNGTVNSIICDMPQALFNQYFSSIIAGACVQVPSGNPITSGNCSNFDTSYSPTVTVPQPPPNNNPPGYTMQSFFFDNPTLSMGLNDLGGPNSYMLHGITSTSTTVNTSDWCLLNSNHPNYISGKINYWVRMDSFVWIDENGVNNGPFLTANAVLDFLITTYPAGGFNYGMNADDIRTTTQNLPQFASFTIYYGATWGLMSSGGSAITGTYSETYTEVCSGGSFIMFSKDNKVNLSSALGYYASATLRNDSLEKAELFNIGADIFESSK